MIEDLMEHGFTPKPHPPIPPNSEDPGWPKIPDRKPDYMASGFNVPTFLAFLVVFVFALPWAAGIFYVFAKWFESYCNWAFRLAGG